MDFLIYFINLIIDKITLDNILKAIELILVFWGCTIAWRGLKTWREQVIEEPKINLAREIVESFYNMRDLIKRIRYPLVEYNPTEIKKFFNNDWWNEHQCYYFYHIMLIKKSMDQIIYFQNLKNKAKVFYSSDIEACFVEIIRIINEIQDACQTLGSEYGKEKDERSYSRKDIKELETIISIKAIDDPINPKLEQIITEVEYNLKPLYENKKMKWKKIKPVHDIFKQLKDATEEIIQIGKK